MANVLSKDEQVAVIGALAEGSSILPAEFMLGHMRLKIERDLSGI